MATLTSQQFFARYHISQAYVQYRLAHPHPDDPGDLSEPDALVSPAIKTEPPLFAENMVLVDEENASPVELEPEWIQDFGSSNPFESMNKWRHNDSTSTRP